MPPNSGNSEKVERLLAHHVEKAIDQNQLRSALLAGKRLKVKLGIDPTSPDLHLGHAVVLRKLREFQDLGSLAILIIGDFTAQIGDPSGRDKTRPPLTEAQVKANLKNYLRQAGKIIDIKKAKIEYNSTWLGKLKGSKLLELLSQVSVQQIIEREDFHKRLSEHKPIRMHELLYPIMQAYDSVAIEADVELGGTDQTFNLLVGRDLMEKMGMPPQNILTMAILEGTDGEKKMSKSIGNYIGLDDVPGEMFGKIMSLPDALIERYFDFCVDIPKNEVDDMRKSLGPKALKERLGFEVVRRYHGEKAAAVAQENFEKLFSKDSKDEVPENIPELTIPSSKMSAIDLVLASGVFKSKSEARRLIEQGGLDIGGVPHKDPQGTIELQPGAIVRVGKKSFFRLKALKNKA